MMNCTEYRRSILAAPGALSAQMRAHLESCHDCTRYTEQLLRFEDRLGRALRVDIAPPIDFVPRAGTSRTAKPLRMRRGWLAIAASVLVAAVVAGSLWLAVPGPSLAADVVNHMAEEPQAWRRTDTPVSAPKLDAVLSESHVRLRPGAGLVSYANSCLFRGHQVPHLVVQTEAGPVTVMVLVHESVHESMHFDEQGYRGMIVPVAGHGSLAVLERGPDPDLRTVRDVAARVLDSIEWTADAT
jgi:hypothetical protein